MASLLEKQFKSEWVTVTSTEVHDLNLFIVTYKNMVLYKKSLGTISFG